MIGAGEAKGFQGQEHSHGQLADRLSQLQRPRSNDVLAILVAKQKESQIGREKEDLHAHHKSQQPKCSTCTSTYLFEAQPSWRSETWRGLTLARL